MAPFLLLVACLCWVGHAEAADRWGAVALPGGVAAARAVIDLGRADRPPVTFLLDLARRLHGTPIRENLGISERLLAFVSYLEQLRPQLDQWKGGISIADVGNDRRRRDAIRDTLELLGLRLREDDGVYRVEVGTGDDDVRRVKWLSAIGCDAAAVAKALSAGEPVAIQWPMETLPLPLAYAWPTALRETGTPSLQRIVGDPRAVLFYVGLANLNPTTADWLGTQPELIRRLYEDLSAPFAAFGKSLRVESGGARVPGGAGAAAVWEDLAGARASAPGEFVRRLLEKDDGRLAYFFDAASALDTVRRDFLLGAHLEGPSGSAGRRRYVRAVYAHFTSVEPTWNVREQPFVRPNFEPALAAAIVDVGPNGMVGPAWWPALLTRVTEMSWPDRIQARPLRQTPADALWMLGWLFDPPEGARDRLVLLRFAQRVFAASPESAAPEITIALLSLRDMPPLALALERLGVRDPETFARAGFAARQLTYAGGADDVVPTLRAWQSGLAVLEQVGRHRALSQQTVESIVRALADATPARPSTPHGAISEWFFGALRTALTPALGEADTTESEFLTHALASNPGDDVTLEWEGTAYRFDLLGPAIASATEIRAGMPGPQLVDLVILRRAAAALGGTLASVDAVRAVAAELARVVSALADIAELNGQPHPAGRDLEDAVRNLERIREPRDLPRASRQRAAVLRALDVATAEVLAGLAHALAVAPTDAPPRVYADAARFHGYDAANLDGRWRQRAWAVPELQPRGLGGSGLVGALLGIDRARRVDQLRRSSRDSMPTRPTISAYDHAVITGRLGLRMHGVDWNAGGAAIAQAMTRGRSVVAGWTREAPDAAAVLAALDAASVDAWRAGLVSYLLSQNSAAQIESLLTVADVFRLGTSSTPGAAWGSAAELLDGCWCVAHPSRLPDEFWLNRRASLAATVSIDLPVRLAELLQDARLPHALLEALLPMAVDELLDHVEQITTEDREPFAWPRMVGASQLEAYLLYLVTQQILAPPRGPGPPDAHP